MQPTDFIKENAILKRQNISLEQANSRLEMQCHQFSQALANSQQETAAFKQQFDEIKQQLEWFKRQIFGRKSEKQMIDQPEQGHLFQRQAVDASAQTPSTTVKSHQRRSKQRADDAVQDTGLRFDGSVPVETIEILPKELLGKEADQFEIVGFDETHKLAMRPGSYVILRQRVAKVRKKVDQSFLPTPDVPGRVLERCVIDVSTLAGLMVEKACYHMPLYRQHQRMKDAGITLSRASLSNWVGKGIELLRPIYDAQHQSVLQSRLLAMDEVPMKAGRSGKGKMQQTYFWPIYGDKDEVVFTWSKSRGHQHALDQLKDFAGTLITDGYEAYEKTVIALNRESHQLTHANCWVHTRRQFEKALPMEPKLAQYALDAIAKLYQLEAKWREQELSPDTVIEKRREQSEPIVHGLFAWIDQQIQDPALLPSNPLTKALHYARKRFASLKVFLANPLVPLDTNHLERALRVIPMGRKNFLFCWSELGAEQLGILQSLMVTCRLHEVNPYRYLVDVLQRISQHPNTKVEELIPRNWKAKFADSPLTSLLNDIDHAQIRTSEQCPYQPGKQEIEEQPKPDQNNQPENLGQISQTGQSELFDHE